MRNSRGMKRAAVILTSLALVVGVFSGNTILAKADAPSAVLYYNIQSNSNTTLSVGTSYYISTNAGLADSSFASAAFPSDKLNAQVQVTSDLVSSYMHKASDGPDAYPVQVVKKDSQFDGCTTGYLFYKTSENMWRYNCSGGGVFDRGPYNLYDISTLNYTADDVQVTTATGYVANGSSQTITSSDIVVQIVKDGITFAVSDYTFSDDQINPSSTDDSITLNVSGLSVTHVMGTAPTVPAAPADVTVKAGAPSAAEPETQPEAPVVRLSEESSLSMTMESAIKRANTFTAESKEGTAVDGVNVLAMNMQATSGYLEPKFVSGLEKNAGTALSFAFGNGNTVNFISGLDYSKFAGVNFAADSEVSTANGMHVKSVDFRFNAVQKDVNNVQFNNVIPVTAEKPIEIQIKENGVWKTWKSLVTNKNGQFGFTMDKLYDYRVLWAD